MSRTGELSGGLGITSKRVLGYERHSTLRWVSLGFLGPPPLMSPAQQRQRRGTFDQLAAHGDQIAFPAAPEMAPYW